MSEVLVVAGEASGDRAAAPVVARLVARGAHVFGMGGKALEAAGADLDTRLEDATAVGASEVARRGLSIALARAKIEMALRKRSPRAALLVNYTEFNLGLAASLKDRGVRVLWYIAPQIWAWRAGRADKLRRRVDRLAVVLPFEEALWREHGVDARYVGHPALEEVRLDRGTARTRLALTPFAPAVAILPGSRPHEVRSLLPTMLEAYEAVRRDRASLDARVLLARSLDPSTLAFAQDRSRDAHVASVLVDPRTGANPLLGAFDAALCASGTASLEAALAHAAPVVAYRVSLATELVLRPFVRTPFFALPNVLLKRKAFPELLQRDASVTKMVQALRAVLGSGRASCQHACEELLPIFGDKREPSREVAEMIAPWL